MKKVISILLSICICITLCSALCFTSSALTDFNYVEYDYYFGKKAINPFEQDNTQGFTAVMTNYFTSADAVLNPDTLLEAPYIGLEENCARWGLNGKHDDPWTGVNGSWGNWTAIRSDGRIMPSKVAAGVRFDVPESGVYNVHATFLGGSAANGYIHYIFLKSGDTIQKLYAYDTVEVEATNHEIGINDRIQSYENVYLKKGDKLFFVMDSKGQSVPSGVYPNLRVAVDLVSADPVPDTFEPTVLSEYSFGTKAKNDFSEKGMQNFFPVFSKETGKKEAFPVWTMVAADGDVSVEENANKWSNSGYQYAGVRADGRLAAHKCTLGVVWVAPADGTYVYTTTIKYNGTPANPMYYSVYHGVAEGSTATRLYVYDDSVDGDQGADEGIVKLKKGDRLYFILDSNGQSMSGIYPHASVSIKEEPVVPSTFEPTVLGEYSFGYTAKNILSEKGMQNFFPVFSDTSDELPIWNMIGSDKDPVSESDSWGSYTKWLSSTYQYAYVRSSGHIQPQLNSAAGVVWVAPKDGKYDIKNIEIAFNIVSGKTVTTLYYNVYYFNAATNETTCLFSYTNNSEEENQFIDRINLKKGDRLYFLMDLAENSGNNANPRIRLTIKHVADTPDAPVAINQTATSVTLNATEGYEYGYTQGDSTSITYSNSNVIENLEAGKTYKIYQRAKETEKALASDDSAVLEYTMSKPGDIDRDNEIGATDLTILRKYLLNLPTEGSYFEGLMNANSIGGIDIRDLVALKIMSSQVS